MVSIKRNTKGELQVATGIRSRASSMYTPGQNSVFKISRSKFSDFLDCPRCFYLDRVKGLQSPSMPGWALNTAVDELLKKEFDFYRAQKKPHPIFDEYKLNFIPFEHEDIDIWRNSLRGGIGFEDEETNLFIHGGVDDLWFDIDKQQVVVADYKAQSSSYPIEKETYLGGVYHQGYKIQMDIYVYILRKMGYSVSDTAYFMVCNGEKTPDRFDANMQFVVKLVDYQVDINWVGPKIKEMKQVMDSPDIPETNPNCENCAYIQQAEKLSQKSDII